LIYNTVIKVRAKGQNGVSISYERRKENKKREYIYTGPKKI
jgi:hypothetical protein